MQRFVDLTLNGIAGGAIYAAVALSLVLIWRATRILNFAQGAMLMVTTFIGTSVLAAGGGYWLALAVALASGFALGAVVERVLIRRIEGAPPLNAVVVTIGLFVLLVALAGMIWGGNPRSYPPAFGIRGYDIGGHRVLFAPNDLFVVVAVGVVMVALVVLFRLTSLGLRMRAAAFEPEVARLLGVRVTRMFTMGWGLAATAGALAGVLVAPSVFVAPNNFDGILVFGFTAAVLGGLESPPGALVGGVTLGVALSYVSGYLGPELVTLGALVILVAVLMVRPQGLFAHAGGAKGLMATPAATLGALPLPRHTLVRHLLIALLGAVALFVLSLALSQFDNLQLATMAYYFVAVAGLTVLTGLNGQISLGHGALMAVGAYTTAKLADAVQLPLALLLVAAALMTALVGVAAGAAAARLRGPYLAGATLALAVGLPALANRYDAFLGGENGLTVAPPTPPLALGETFPLERWQAWIACAAALITYVLLANLVRSRYGRTLRAVRDDEVAAAISGLHVARLQVIAFVVSAACAGLAGGLFVVVNSLAAPGAFRLDLSIALLTGAVLGGLGSLAGAIWGAAAIVLLPTWAEDLSKALSLPAKVEANLPLAVYGVVLIVVMLAAPQGIQGAVRRAAALVTGQRFRGRAAEQEEEVVCEVDKGS